MHVVVIGAGAVGGYFGGRLAHAGAHVTFMVREQRYLQLQRDGLRIHSVHGDFSIQPNLARSVTEVNNPDVVMLAVKNYHFEAILPDVAALVEKGAKVLPLLNGVRHMETLLDAFGSHRVLGGTCFIETSLDSAGNVVQTSPMHDITFGPLGPVDEAFLADLEAALVASGVNVRRSPAVMVDMWKKYLFLSTFSGITAATRRPIGDVQADLVASALLTHLIEEVVAVALAKDPTLPDTLLDTTLARFDGLPGTMTSSLHRDLEKGLPLELDSLQGALIDIGQQVGVPTPNLDVIYAILHPYARGSSGHRN